MILKDKQNRDNAVEVCDRNIIVEAGAGTGKTTLLVKKILYLIFVKKVKLSRLIALTFTKKAAASLKQKLQEDLYNAYKILLHNNFVLNTNDTDFEIRLQEYTKEESDNFKKFRPLFKKSGLQLNELFDIIGRNTLLPNRNYTQFLLFHTQKICPGSRPKSQYKYR